MRGRSLGTAATRRSFGGAVLAAALAACGPIDTGGGAAPGLPGSSAPAQAPGVAIVSPSAGQTCAADKHGKSCPVVVSVSNAALAEPGSCPPGRVCGHLELFVDGKACGDPNNESSATSFPALFGRCRKVNGAHTLSCELRDDRETTLAASPAVPIQVQHENENNGQDDD